MYRLVVFAIALLSASVSAAPAAERAKAANAGADAARRAAILAPTADFSKAERWEELPGGTATNRTRFDQDAFSQPSANLSFEERSRFLIGNGLFRRTWVTAPSSTQSADGLGPLFNARGCQSCHLKDGRGHPPAYSDDSSVSMFLRLSVPPTTSTEKDLVASGRIAVIAEPTYGGQLQDLAIPGHAPEGRMTIRYDEVPVTLSDGEVVPLRRPTYGVADAAYGPMRDDTLMSPRVAPPMIGMGLLEAIDEADILARADPDDADGDGISGKANRVWSDIDGKPMLGRFGWKAGQPTVAQQAAMAAAGDMGLSNPIAPDPWGDCTERQSACRAGPDGEDEDGFEVSAQMLDLIVFYSRNLGVPARRDAGSATVLRGKELFYGAGCAACHTPKFATRADHEAKALARQLVWPYSDLLLHDMGDGLADGRPEGLADGREWRTAPLWGLGFTRTVSGHTFFLHDGRARNLTEAVLWHGGEAQPARERFAAMAKADRDAVIAFLNSL